jgi:hypothetical protein
MRNPHRGSRRDCLPTWFRHTLAPMDALPRRDRTLALWVLLTVLLAAVVTPLAVAVSHPLVHDWDTTVGFVAGVAAACVGIRGVLGRLR